MHIYEIHIMIKISDICEKIFKTEIAQNNERHSLIESSHNLFPVYLICIYAVQLGARDFISLKENVRIVEKYACILH